VLNARCQAGEWKGKMKVKELTRDSDGKLPAFAWPGGYPMFYLDKQGSTLCANCATKSLVDIEFAEDFGATDCDVHWEGQPLICEECNCEIESAYGEPDPV